MAALTVAELRARAVAADLDAMLGDLDTVAAQDAVIQDALDEVDADLAGYCTGRYNVPLVATDQVKRFEFDLAWFVLCRRKSWNYGEQEREDEKALRRKFELISKRKYHLTGQGTPHTVDQMTSLRATDPSATTTGRTKIFGRDKLRNL